MNSRVRTIFFGAVFLAISGVGAYSQTMSDAIERVKAIKLLESDRIAVKQTLYEMTFDGSFDNRDDFTYGIFDIEVFYSAGECDEDEEEIFQAEKGKAIRVVITSSEEFEVAHLGFDLSKLKKEQMYRDNEERFIYHDKKIGLAVMVDDGDVDDVILFPAVSTKGRLCDSKAARDFVKLESWFGSKKLEDRIGTISCGNQFANVTEVQISETLITALTPKHVRVSTIAVDPENDVLTHNYVVSAGKIVGSGKSVIWDLTGVSPGTYSITAGVDDGCGFCGQTKTKSVTVQ